MAQLEEGQPFPGTWLGRRVESVKLGRGNRMLVGRFYSEAEIKDSGESLTPEQGPLEGPEMVSGTHVENEGVSWLAISVFFFSI